MGVSGSGKSTLGLAIGQRLSVEYIDGDDYHPQANIDKMARGEALDDADRAGWLAQLKTLIADYRERGASLLLGCSALKHDYRAALREGDAALRFLFLDGSYDVILARMRERQHFFSPTMLRTQFDTLERATADEAIKVDISADFDQVVDNAIAALRADCRGPG